MLLVVLCGCETWSVTVRKKEHRFVVSDKKVWGKIFGIMMEELTRGLSQLHTVELHLVLLVLKWGRKKYLHGDPGGVCHALSVH